MCVCGGVGNTCVQFTLSPWGQAVSFREMNSEIMEADGQG